MPCSYKTVLWKRPSFFGTHNRCGAPHDERDSQSPSIILAITEVGTGSETRGGKPFLILTMRAKHRTYPETFVPCSHIWQVTPSHSSQSFLFDCKSQVLNSCHALTQIIYSCCLTLCAKAFSIGQGLQYICITCVLKVTDSAKRKRRQS